MQAKKLKKPRSTLSKAGTFRSSRIEAHIHTCSRQLNHHEYDLLVIVASTGGPVAIQRILTEIPVHCPIPIMLVQHMPGNFTKSFAERLNQLCKVQVREAENNDELQAGLALLAPGGQQIEVESRGGKKLIALKPKNVSDIYSPCADVTLSSVTKVYQDKALAIVLTGMGADGRDGAIAMQQAGSEIWAQEESSCTIYGMPKAVVEAGVVSKVCTLEELMQIFREIS